MIKKIIKPVSFNVIRNEQTELTGKVTLFLHSQANPLGVKSDDSKEFFESYFEELREGRVYILFKNETENDTCYLPIEISNPQISGELANVNQKVSEAFLNEYGKICEQKQSTNVDTFLNIIGPMLEGKLDMMSIMSNAASVMSFFDNDVYDFSAEYVLIIGAPDDESNAKFYKNLWNSLSTQVAVSKLNLKKAWRNPLFMSKIAPLFGKFLNSNDDTPIGVDSNHASGQRILRMN